MMEWQPIETAPKDGTKIVAYWWLHYETEGEMVGADVIWWTENGWRGNDFGFEGEIHSHWMPLPEAPKWFTTA